MKKKRLHVASWFFAQCLRRHILYCVLNKLEVTSLLNFARTLESGLGDFDHDTSTIAECDQQFDSRCLLATTVDVVKCYQHRSTIVPCWSHSESNFVYNVTGNREWRPLILVLSFVKLAFHDADTDTDTDTDSPNTATILRPTRAISSRGSRRGCPCRIPRHRHRNGHPRRLARHAYILAMILARMSVSVSASWNSSLNVYTRQLSHPYGDWDAAVAAAAVVVIAVMTINDACSDHSCKVATHSSQ